MGHGREGAQEVPTRNEEGAEAESNDESPYQGLRDCSGLQESDGAEARAI